MKDLIYIGFEGTDEMAEAFIRLDSIQTCRTIKNGFTRIVTDNGCCYDVHESVDGVMKKMEQAANQFLKKEGNSPMTRPTPIGGVDCPERR